MLVFKNLSKKIYIILQYIFLSFLIFNNFSNNVSTIVNVYYDIIHQIFFLILNKYYLFNLSFKNLNDSYTYI